MNKEGVWDMEERRITDFDLVLERFKSGRLTVEEELKLINVV